MVFFESRPNNTPSQIQKKRVPQQHNKIKKAGAAIMALEQAVQALVRFVPKALAAIMALEQSVLVLVLVLPATAAEIKAAQKGMHSFRHFRQ